MEFAGGRASLVAVKAYYGGKLVDTRSPRCASTFLISIPVLRRFIVKDIPYVLLAPPLSKPMTRFFIADTRHISTVMEELQKLETKYRRIMIVGGGNIGAGLAKQLESDHRVKLIERDMTRVPKSCRNVLSIR